MRNDEALARLREAVASQSRSNWTIGDLLIEICGPPERGRPSSVNVPMGAFLPLAQVADEVGISHKAAGAYRRVAYQWPPERRRSDLSWTVHRDLAQHVPEEEERFSLIHSRDWTIPQVREVYAAASSVYEQQVAVGRAEVNALRDHSARLLALASCHGIAGLAAIWGIDRDQLEDAVDEARQFILGEPNPEVAAA